MIYRLIAIIVAGAIALTPVRDARAQPAPPYSRLEVVLSRDVVQNDPVGVASNLAFTGTDRRVCAHLTLYEVGSSNTIRYEMLRPNGSTYDREEQKTEPPPARQYWLKYRAWYCWPIADRPLALTLGTWTVRISVNGRVVKEQGFQIIAAGMAGSDKIRDRLQILQARVTANPTDPQARVDLAGVLIDLNELDEAIVQLRKASELNPQLVQPYAILGRVYFLRGQLEDAERSLLAAIRLQGDYALAHYWVGRVYKEKGDTAKAVEHFRRVVQIEGDTSLRKYALEELDKLGASP